MARISTDGKHLEVTLDPKWREKQQAKEEKRKNTEAVQFAVETYHHAGAGPSAAELNKEAAKNSKMTQRLGESEKNLTYTGKYLEAKGEMVSSTEQSFRDYQAELGLNEDYKRLDEMKAEFAKNPSQQLAQEHDALLDAVIKKEQMLKVYEKAYLDTVESYNTLAQQGQNDWKTYQKAWEDWDKNRRVFHYIMDEYQENDWDQLSDEAKTALQGHEGYQNETSQATIDWIGEKLVSIDDEIEVTQKKYDEKLMYYRDYYHEHGEYPEGYPAAEADLNSYQKKIHDLEAEKKQYQQVQKNESNELDFRKQYGGLKYNSDFQQYARYAPIGYGLTPNPSTIDTTYVRINSAARQENDAGEGYLGEMTPSEVQTFNYIYRKNGKDAAEEYMRELTPVLNRRDRESTEEAISEFAGENWFTGTLASIGSVLTKPLEGISYLGQGLDYLADGEIDENAPYNVFVYGNNAARSTVNENIKKHWGEAGSFMYQLGMGLADFTYTMVLSHGLATGAGALGAPIGSVAKAASNLSLAIMSTEAAAETVLDAKDRGLEDGDAFWLGTIAGATELLTEKVSIDTLLSGIGKGKSKLGYLLKNALTEGSEEMTSDAVNWFADVMISKDKSEWEEILFYYRALGFSEDKAFMEALKEQGRQMLKDGAAGAITGVAAAGGRLALGQIGEGSQDYKNYQEAVQNGRRYYALNNLTKGKLARGLGNMDVEKIYRHVPPSDLNIENLAPQDVRWVLDQYAQSLDEGLSKRGNHFEIPQKNINDILRIEQSLDTPSQYSIMSVEEKQRLNDPMYEVTGDAMVSHPEAVNKMIADLKSSGAECIIKEGGMGYMPSSEPGKPGQFRIAPGTSYSGWCHEYKHFCDDRAKGYPGVKNLMGVPTTNIGMEHNAYQTEIDMARATNRPDIVEALEQLWEKEVLTLGRERRE